MELGKHTALKLISQKPEADICAASFTYQPPSDMSYAYNHFKVTGTRIKSQVAHLSYASVKHFLS